MLTGATGFLGRHCLAVVTGSAASVHAVCRHPAPLAFTHVTWHAADLRDPRQVRDLIGTVRPTHLLHCAWMAVPGRFWTDPDNTLWLDAGIAMLEAFGQVRGQRFVGVGTCAEYDWRADRFVEDETPIEPATLYGRTKAALAERAREMAASYGFSSAWGRVFLPYGPCDARQRLIPTVLDALAHGRTVDLSDGTQERDFIFAGDVADLLTRLLASDAQGAFNVGTGQGSSVRRVVEGLADRFGGRDLLRFGALPQRSDEPQHLVADMSKVRRVLGWHAATDIEAGLERVVADWRSQSIEDRR